MKDQSIIAKRKSWRKRIEKRYPWMTGKLKFVNGFLCDLLGNPILVAKSQSPRLLKNRA